MNVQSIILLIIIMAVFLLVGYRYVRRQKRSRGCGSCNCGCDGCDTCH
ncbi:MAG: FeoB-associated Cys-rich membrane protein [Bacteroidaceae bacterium]|nr:FeoB-associated Cys-rich membrane protein [Bacteroidaceae bacterium]